MKMLPLVELHVYNDYMASTVDEFSFLSAVQTKHVNRMGSVTCDVQFPFFWIHSAQARLSVPMERA